MGGSEVQQKTKENATTRKKCVHKGDYLLFNTSAFFWVDAKTFRYHGVKPLHATMAFNIQHKNHHKQDPTGNDADDGHSVVVL